MSSKINIDKPSRYSGVARVIVLGGGGEHARGEGASLSRGVRDMLHRENFEIYSSAIAISCIFG